MIFIILAAGKGTRLYPLTKKKTKMFGKIPRKINIRPSIGKL